MPTLLGRQVLLPLGGAVHRRGMLEVQAGPELVADLGRRYRRDEVHLGGQQRTDVAPGIQLGVRDHQQASLAGECLEGLYRADDLGDLPGVAGKDAGEDRDAAVGGHPDAGLDLLQVHPPVLGMPELDHRVVLVLPGLGVGAVHGHARHIPVDAGHIDAEVGDRGRPDAAGRPDQVAVSIRQRRAGASRRPPSRPPAGRG
ncbi:hypothetical protein ACIBJC_23460 [Streptomyces sp. NPDC050509]|uniref:hypothetical protein n=1 Tax=Streptomyces sp. NPDC050509 TaxID=3365620 RepID=UPI0037947704